MFKHPDKFNNEKINSALQYAETTEKEAKDRSGADKAKPSSDPKSVTQSSHPAGGADKTGEREANPTAAVPGGVAKDKPLEGANDRRRTHQPLLPKTVAAIQALRKTPESEVENTAASDDGYDIYPYSSLGCGKIQAGFDRLARWVSEVTASDGSRVIAIDGFPGVDFRAIRCGLSAALEAIGLLPGWVEMEAYTKTPADIEAMVRPYLGAEDSVWGKKTALQMADFFQLEGIDQELTAGQLSQPGSDLTIVLGTGAGLAAVAAPVLFIELPKNEIQYRLRAGQPANLYCDSKKDYSWHYKRAYFVDWPIMNQYRHELQPRMRLVADGQWVDTLHFARYQDIREGFERIARAPLRVRPWFAPGAWGGDWMKRHIPRLNPAEVNYAWSFELIVPENGIILESDGILMELPFDWLMDQSYQEVLGKDSKTFGSYFPIRFDFLDTFHGGNLSIQCHPSVAYIQEHFKEKVTQDETYYILDTAPDARVYLGFQEDIDADAFKTALLKSQQEQVPVRIEDYVQHHPVNKHDLFLIPNQTVHSSGTNNLVLEISATPYIFTFKLYDWLRPDLNGKPRPINIEHGFKNLDFNRKGEVVKEQLISKPVLLERTAVFERWNLPTHPEHYYAIHRLHLNGTMTEQTDDQCHIMMVVEGDAVEVVTENENQRPSRRRFHYGETFIIPAATGSYQLENPDPGHRIKIVKAFVK